MSYGRVTGGVLPTVGTMNAMKNLQWPLVWGLGALALARPLASILEYQLDLSGGPAVSLTLTGVISLIWIAVVGLTGVARPVLTLVATGLTYGVLSIALSGLLSPVLTGELQGPLAMPVAIVPVLITNVIWGAVAGAVALLVQRVLGTATRADRPPPTPPTPRAALLRTAGVGLAGLLGGGLVGLLVLDVIGATVLRGDVLTGSLPLALAVGFLVPLLAVVGVVVALVADRLTRNRS